MLHTTHYKKVFQKHWVQQNRDRTHLPSEKKEYYDGVHPFFDIVGTFTDEESFKKYIKDPLYSVNQKTLTVVVEQKGEKISIKLFHKIFSRKVGKSYFISKKNMRFITVNSKTGNIYFGELYNYQNKRNFQKKIRCNSYITESLNTFRVCLKNNISEFNVDDCGDLTIELLRIFTNLVDGGNENLSISTRLFKYYLLKKNIKYPNNYPIYSTSIDGNFRKILKKVDNKIVDAFMIKNEIQGKKIKKILHTVQGLNVSNYKIGLKLFGSDWLNQDEQLLRNIFNNKIEFALSDNLIDDFIKFASPKEMKKVFLLYKSFNNDNEIDGWTFRDHFDFYVQLKRFGDTEVEWKSISYSDFFRQEHLDWTDKLSFYKKGEYQRIYPKKFIQEIKNFEYQNEEYFPKLLTDTKEYNAESTIQSNCVRGYIGRASSVIISLRKNSDISEDRLTIEYRINYLKNSNLINLERVQTKAKYNSNPDESWSTPLRILDSQISSICQKKKFEPYVLKKRCANGIELESNTHFEEDGYLVWSFRAIDNDQYYTNFL